MMRRTWLVVAALAAGMAMASLCAQEAPPETTAKKLTAEELKALVSGSTKYFFPDVREPKELEELGTMRGYVEPVPQKDQCHNALVGDEPTTIWHRTKHSDFV